MTQTTKNVSSQHQHNFNAQGVCSCGLTHEQYRLAEEAKNAPPPEVKDSDVQTPATDEQPAE